MTRRARELSKTDIYHIMLRGNEQKNIFQGSDDKQRFLEGVAAKQKEVNFSVYAYCLMDNHVHLLLNIKNNDLASIMKGIAVRYASFYNLKHSRVGHVFQDRFKSEPVEDERYMMAAVRYIHNNPVKAGMVEKPGDYNWSSYSEYLKPKSQGWMDTNFLLSMIATEPRMAIKEFERFSNEKDEIIFMECEEGKEIHTREEGKGFLTKYLRSKGINLEASTINEDKQLRKEIILHLRNNTTLSQRVIADLLGIDKGVVERVKTNK